MDLTISNARLRRRTDLVDVGIADGRIATIAPAGTVKAPREIRAAADS